MAFDDQRLQSSARGVEGCRQSGAPRPDNHNIASFHVFFVFTDAKPE
jgi:hypothetical protein